MIASVLGATIPLTVSVLFGVAVSVLLGIGAAVAHAAQFPTCPPTVHRAFPLRVVDGDTFRLHGERIRIIGIDTPERGEPGSGRAAYRLLTLLRSGPLTLVRHGKDVYCRTLADVYVNGWNVAAVLRAEGYAKDEGAPVRFRRRGWRRAGGGGRS